MKRKNTVSISVLITLVLVSLVGGISAKYVYEIMEKNLISAKVFYFESNLLREEPVEYVLNPTATSITFTVSNGVDELRYSEDAIDYTVSYQVDGEVFSLSGGTLENNQVNTASITIDGLQKGKTYDVQVTGTAGYRKRLQATFTVSDTDKNLYKHLEQNNNYVLLTVWTENLSGDVEIEFPDGLIPDGSDSILREVSCYDESEKRYVSKKFVDSSSFDKVYSSKVYRFFVDESGLYSVNQFNVQRINDQSIVIAGDGIPH